jgi:hypothetical protein
MIVHEFFFLVLISRIENYFKGYFIKCVLSVIFYFEVIGQLNVARIIATERLGILIDVRMI